MRRLFLALLSIVVLAPAPASDAAPPAATPPTAASRQVVAYYFHGDVRCSSCRKIEAWSAQAIDRAFEDELQAGRLAWRPTNIDRAENEHFVRDYELVTRSLVLVEFESGRQVRWKNLGQVWELLGDEVRFSQYVQREVRAFLDGR